MLALRVSPAAQTFELITAGATAGAYGRDYFAYGKGIGTFVGGAWEGLRRAEAEAEEVKPFTGKGHRLWEWPSQEIEIEEVEDSPIDYRAWLRGAAAEEGWQLELVLSVVGALELVVVHGVWRLWRRLGQCCRRRPRARRLRLV